MPIYRAYSGLDTQIVQQGDSFFTGFNTRMRADQLPEGTAALSQNGRFDQNGAWVVRRGVRYRAGKADATSEGLTIPFYLYADVVITAASRSTTTVSITTSGAHGFTTGTQVGIYDISGTVDPTGNRTITSTGSNTFTFQIVGATGSETYTLGSSPKAGAGSLSNVVGVCRGSCVFSDPSSSNDEYIIVAYSDKATAFKVNSWSTAYDIAYPAGISITSDVEVLQAFGKVYLLRDGGTALEWDGDTGGSLAFTKVANGDYTQPLVFTSAGNTAASGGVVTVTETSHGLSTGSTVKIFNAGTTDLLEDVFYTVASVPTSDTFTFYADVDDFSATSVVLGKAQSSGLGFSHMPAPPWAVYHQRRLIVPYFYTTTGTSGSETITDREVRDELLISDIMDGDTYDILQSSFKVTGGTADYLQYVHPFTDDNAIIFCRRSIHLLSGLSGAIDDITVKEVTREAGLIARKSVQTIGNRIYFLSDNGVYALTFEDFYNLRGSAMPLSAPIQPTISGLSQSALSKCIAVYENNRYVLAVPSSGGSVLDQLLIYNVINEAWESIDSFDIPEWDIKNILVSSEAPPSATTSVSVFLINSTGGIHSTDSGFFGSEHAVAPGASSAALYDINGVLTTRGYNLGSIGRTRFSEFELEAEGRGTSDFLITYTGRNPDSDGSLGRTFDRVGFLGTGEDAVINGRIGGVRADSLQLTFTSNDGSPFIRSTAVRGEAALSSLTSVS